MSKNVTRTAGVALDPFSAEYVRNPYPAFARLRAAEAAQFVDDLGVWVVSRYDEVRAVLADGAAFSNSLTMSGAAAVLTPSASRTSALPEVEEAARAPCFATGKPAPTMTNAAAVEMLKRLAALEPVPAVSIKRSCCECRGVARFRIACNCQYARQAGETITTQRIVDQLIGDDFCVFVGIAQTAQCTIADVCGVGR